MKNVVQLKNMNLSNMNVSKLKYNIQIDKLIDYSIKIAKDKYNIKLKKFGG